MIFLAYFNKKLLIDFLLFSTSGPKQRHHHIEEKKPIATLEAGLTLPKQYEREFPADLIATPIEDLDKYYEETGRAVSFVAFSFDESWAVLNQYYSINTIDSTISFEIFESIAQTELTFSPCSPQTFMVVSKNKDIFRFSAAKAMYLLDPFNPIRRVALYMLVHPFFSFLVIVTILTVGFFEFFSLSKHMQKIPYLPPMTCLLIYLIFLLTLSSPPQ